MSKTTEHSGLQAWQVGWYATHGRYPRDRIQMDSRGRWYVVGDFSWNRGQGRRREFIEDDMTAAFESQPENT